MKRYIYRVYFLKMTDAQTHLKSAIEQRDNIVNEIAELNKQINSKRELGLKVQGIIEYLEQTGVKLPEETPHQLQRNHLDQRKRLLTQLLSKHYTL